MKTPAAIDYENIPGLRLTCRVCKKSFGLKKMVRSPGRDEYKHQKLCKECHNAYKREQRRLYPEKHRAQSRKSHAKHPEYLRKNRIRRRKLCRLGYRAYMHRTQIAAWLKAGKVLL